SLGCSVCRPSYASALLEFGRAHAAELCDNCRRRVERNPLRLLDCKNPTCREINAHAPLVSDHWCADCQQHFATVRTLLEREDVPFRHNPRLVRGLDYYCRTAFEATAEGLGSQNAVGGGGRYDGLVKSFGGPHAPGIGFALGLERLVLSMPEASKQQLDSPELYIAPLGDAAEGEAAHLAHQLRRSGMRVETSSGGKSLKSQMRLADKLGVAHVLIIGESEIAARAATIRDMVAKRDFPQALPFPTTADAVRASLSELNAAPH
ncbi:MAG TPA: ATP phosphoribosyltransferase regulatory subunit, partial [Terriglobales bacterium]|nr:ATP phosphoribosyltransferase regulatory subunit [Terriglobales bacterium]